jgi:hypothetical protein
VGGDSDKLVLNLVEPFQFDVPFDYFTLGGDKFVVEAREFVVKLGVSVELLRRRGARLSLRGALPGRDNLRCG